MTPRFGIDTSVLMRLLTGEPEAEFDRCVAHLSDLVLRRGAEVFVGNQVLGESYIALQHHYRISKVDARAGLAKVLGSGLVAPLNGREILDILALDTGCGLMDRLIANDYQRAGLVTLTLNQRMSSLSGCQRI